MRGVTIADEEWPVAKFVRDPSVRQASQPLRRLMRGERLEGVSATRSWRVYDRRRGVRGGRHSRRSKGEEVKKGERKHSGMVG